MFFVASCGIYFLIFAWSGWRWTTALARYYELYRQKIDPTMPPRTFKGSWDLYIGRTRAPRDYMSREWFKRMPNTWSMVSTPQDDPELEQARQLAQERRTDFLLGCLFGGLIPVLGALMDAALAGPR